MKLTPTLTLVALALIGVGGFIAGRVSISDRPPAEQEAQAEVRTIRSASRDSTAEVKRTPRPLAREKSNAGGTIADQLARMEAIVRGENPLDRNRALLAFIDKLAPGDFEQVVANFRSLGITDSRMGEYSLLLTAWAQADPFSALTYAKKNTTNSFATDTILTSWATNDPEAAIRWAMADFTGEGANPHLPGIIRGLIESDPTRATQLLAAMPRSEERAKGLDYMIPHLLQQGSEATRAWIAGITDESLRNGAILRAAEKLALTDPAGTASWLLANPGEAAQRRMNDVYSAWAKQDPQAALASMKALPAGDYRSNALRGMVSSVASADPKAAVTLMDQYANDVTDRVVQNFIWHSYGTDPAIAASQISRIGDERQRDQMYRRMLDNWIERDPTSAQAWLQTNAVPQSIRDRIASRQAQQP
ncbi:MAG: hypothetical protein ACRCXD_01485 [Luteolibacter sp.]